MHGKRRRAVRAVEGGRLDRRARRGALAREQVGQPQVIELRGIADEDERRRFAVVDRHEAVVAAQVSRTHVVTRLDLERQFARPADAARRLQVGHEEDPAGDRHRHFGFQCLERREIGIDRHQRADDVLAAGLRQPGAALVIKQDVPFVPQPGVVLELDAADDGKVAATKAPLAADLDARRVVHQLGHAAEVLQRLAVTQQRAVAELADRVQRRRRAEADRCAAGRALRGFHGQPVGRRTRRVKPACRAARPSWRRTRPARGCPCPPVRAVSRASRRLHRHSPQAQASQQA